MSNSYDRAIASDSMPDYMADGSEFLDRQTVYVNDTNQGSYNDTIQFNMSSIASSNKYVDFKNSWLEIPFCITASASNNAMLNADHSYLNNFLVSLRNGTHHLLNSVVVSLNNNTIIPTTNLANVMIHYNLMSSWSSDDFETKGSTIHMAKPSPLSHLYSADFVDEGIGSCNTNIAPYNDNVALVEDHEKWFARNVENKERLKRMEKTSFSVGDTRVSAAIPNNYVVDQLKDHVEAVEGTNDRVYYITARIKLSDIHSYFSEVGLIRNANYEFTFETNCQTTTNITINGAGNATAISVSSRYRTNPVEMSPLTRFGGTAGTFKIQTSIVKPAATQQGVQPVSHTLKSCRLVFNLYDMAPAFEKLYLADPTKTFKFEKYTLYQTGDLQNVGVGSIVNTQLSASMVHMKKLVMVATYSKAVNGNITPFESPFSDDFLSSPVALVSDLNVIVGGRPIYQQNIRYTYEQFLREVGNDDGNIGSAITAGLASSVWSQQMHEVYPLTVCNLSRGPTSASLQPQSLSITFRNSSAFACDYHVFVITEHEMGLNKETGKIESINGIQV